MTHRRLNWVDFDDFGAKTQGMLSWQTHTGRLPDTPVYVFASAIYISSLVSFYPASSLFIFGTLMYINRRTIPEMSYILSIGYGPRFYQLKKKP